jgi:hypothetical protein
MAENIADVVSVSVLKHFLNATDLKPHQAQSKSVRKHINPVQTRLLQKQQCVISPCCSIDSYFTRLSNLFEFISIQFKLVLTLAVEKWRTKLDNTRVVGRMNLEVIHLWVLRVPKNVGALKGVPDLGASD